MGKMSF